MSSSCGAGVRDGGALLPGFLALRILDGVGSGPGGSALSCPSDAGDRMGGRQGFAATLLVIAGIVLIVVPTTVLMGSLGDSVHNLIGNVQDNTLRIPAPPSELPTGRSSGRRSMVFVAGSCGSAGGTSAHAAEAGRAVGASLAIVASIGGSVLLFLFFFILAGVIMAFGRSGAGRCGRSSIESSAVDAARNLQNSRRRPFAR